MASNNLMKMFSVSLLLLVIAQTGWAIHCFVCNSHAAYQGSECWQLTAEDKNNTKYYKNCATEYVNGTDYVRCRIQVQTVGEDNRIIRTCAKKHEIQSEVGCIDRTGTSKIKLRYCECKEDGCNGSTSVFASISAVLLGLAVACRLL